MTISTYRCLHVLRALDDADLTSEAKLPSKQAMTSTHSVVPLAENSHVQGNKRETKPRTGPQSRATRQPTRKHALGESCGGVGECVLRLETHKGASEGG